MAHDSESTKNSSALNQIGEFGLIGEIAEGLPSHPDVLLGPGDDAAVVAFGSPVVVSTDVLVEGVHFRRDWSSAEQVGRKAVAVNVSDIEAMGGAAKALVVGFSAPGDLPSEWALACMAGMASEAAACGVAIVGGDTTASRDVTIAVTVFGECADAPVTRAGAMPGQVVAITGRLGWAAGGLAVLSRGFKSPRELVAAHQVPQPPYGQGRVAAAAGATALIDVSDGLLGDLAHIAQASGVGIDVDSGAFDLPEPLQRVGAATGIDPLALVLTGGEDHALAGCFDRAAVPGGWRIVGRVLDGDGVLVDGAPWTGGTGWDHFKR